MIERLETTKKSSRVVRHNGLIFLSGLTPDNPDQDAAAQTLNVLQKIDRFLALSGSDKTHLLSGVVYVREIDVIPEVNAVWEDWVPEGHAPARTCVCATPARSQCLLEITVIAAGVSS